jgi:hypothetical protein
VPAAISGVILKDTGPGMNPECWRYIERLYHATLKREPKGCERSIAEGREGDTEFAESSNCCRPVAKRQKDSWRYRPKRWPLPCERLGKKLQEAIPARLVDVSHCGAVPGSGDVCHGVLFLRA